MQVRLSVVIPALNEAAQIAATLAPLQAMRGRGAEVLLADGGSADATREIAAPLVDKVLSCDKGRARQMNAGAGVATGEALLFLHADSLLAEDADIEIKRTLAGGKRWGHSDVGITGTHCMLPVIAWFMNRRSRLTGIATGDQGLFLGRAAWEAVGGFPDQPLMEDVEICVRLGKLYPRAARAVLAAPIFTSGRHWEKRGVWGTIFLMWRLRWQYFFGADPALLHQRYYGR